MPAVPESVKRRILVVFPTAWDRRQLENCRPVWDDRYEVAFAEPSDADCPCDLDAHGYVETLARDHAKALTGVTTSSDYPGAFVAAALSKRLGLPGARPETILGCSHKFYARQVQRDAAPEAVPWFALVDPACVEAAAAALTFPCFVKPVRGAFSVLARRIESLADLAAHVTSPEAVEYVRDYLAIFNRVVPEYTDFAHDGQFFLAEELLSGDQVTVEGYVHRGCVEILGIVDSVMYPGTKSFARFEYPSRLTPTVQARLEDVVRRIIPRHGLAECLFNVEVTYDPERDRIGIIEVNPRLCGQFADLYAKVDGTNTYEVALALAAGDTPRVRRGAGTCRYATSFPLRLFEPTRVVRAPTPHDVTAAEELFPGTHVWLECCQDQSLDDFARLEDGASARYAVVNIGADTPETIQERCDCVVERLGFEFAPLQHQSPTPHV